MKFSLFRYIKKRISENLSLPLLTELHSAPLKEVNKNKLHAENHTFIRLSQYKNAIYPQDAR